MKKKTKKPGKVAAKAKKPRKSSPTKSSKKTSISMKSKAKKPVVLKGKPTKVAKVKGPEPKPLAAKTQTSKQTTKAEKKAEIIAQIAAQATKHEKEVVLTNADGKQYCRIQDCDNEATTDGHCRFHYLALWKRNKIKAKILLGGKLDKYIEDLTSKYPDKYLEMLRKDLSSEKDFTAIINEMDVEDSGDEAENEEEASRFIEEVRGGVPTTEDDDGGF